MNHFKRVLLVVIALVVGGGLGIILLADFNPIKITLFGVACMVLGEIFYQIDQKILKN